MMAVQILHEPCGGDEGRNLDGVVLKRLFVAANERNQSLQGLLFDRLVISSAVCLSESAARQIALQHGPARLSTDVTPRSLSYACNPISRR